MLYFSGDGYTNYGDWFTDVEVAPARWKPGQSLRVQAKLRVSDAHLAVLNQAGVKADGFVMLVTAERTFDADGWLRLPSDERMSTLLTPTGLAIEGGVQGAVTKRFGYGFRTPVDELVTVPLTATRRVDNYRESHLHRADEAAAGPAAGHLSPAAGLRRDRQQAATIT